MKVLKQAKERTMEDRRELQQAVSTIIQKVITEGDRALLEYNERFDGCRRKSLRISPEEIREAYDQVDDESIEDIRKAADNIRAFAEAQRGTVKDLDGFSPMEGVELGHRVIPVDSCLCYVPGGGYPLYSTALMLGIPAKVAGVSRVAACSPVVKGTDKIHPKTLVAMDVAGIDEVYGVGGAHAVAAFAYGTEEISPVKLIVGPGNAYVTEAKRQCYGKVGIDFVAGPSEVLIIADGAARPDWIAADILAQSEHDFLAKGILVTTSEELGRAVIDEVEEQLESLSTAGIARQSWQDYGEVLVVDSLSEAAEYTNEYAPEHLEINVEDESILSSLRNYGSLFIGQKTAEVFGDYASGTNHTLPTLGAAGYTGGVWVGTFLKTCTYQRFTEDAMKKLAPLVASLARGEGLEGHSKAAEIRMKK